jgi:hypothetical protein
VKGKTVASTSLTVHADECEISFEYRGKDQNFENITIEAKAIEGDFYSVQDVAFFIDPSQRAQVAQGLREMAYAIDGGRPLA